MLKHYFHLDIKYLKQKRDSLDKTIKVAVVCKILPHYRLGIFQKLSEFNDNINFTILGDTKSQEGIEVIDWQLSKANYNGVLNWIKTKNYFYKPNLLLWQTGIIKNIIFSKYKVYIFEGGTLQLPIWLFAFLCKIFNKKVLLWTHGLKGRDYGIKKIIRYAFFKYFSDGLLLYGNYQKEIMLHEGFNPKKLFVIYNSLQSDKQFNLLYKIDSESISLKKSQLFTNSSFFTLIFIGRLVREKHVFEILKAIYDFKNLNQKINIIIIGDGPEKNILQNYCIVNNLNDQVYFAGSIYQEEEIAKYFLMSDLMLSPGNVGLNCIHALTYGVPVMTHDYFPNQGPEVEAIQNGKTGTFFKYNDFDDMSKKLAIWILNRRKDKQLSSECQIIIKNTYNPSNQLKCIINAITEII